MSVAHIPRRILNRIAVARYGDFTVDGRYFVTLMLPVRAEDGWGAWLELGIELGAAL